MGNQQSCRKTLKMKNRAQPVHFLLSRWLRSLQSWLFHFNQLYTGCNISNSRDVYVEDVSSSWPLWRNDKHMTKLPRQAQGERGLFRGNLLQGSQRVRACTITLPQVTSFLLGLVCLCHFELLFVSMTLPLW